MRDGDKQAIDYRLEADRFHRVNIEGSSINNQPLSDGMGYNGNENKVMRNQSSIWRRLTSSGSITHLPFL